MSSTSTTDSPSRPEPASEGFATVPVLALTLPGAVLILATAWMLLGLPFGIDPLWHVEPLTLPEAAALHDNGEVVRLIGAGEDPNKAATVRAEYLRDDAMILTPLEAAVGIDRVDMVEVLLENGAVLDGPTWTRLMCFAASIEADEVRGLLEQRRPPHASDNCAGVQTPW